MDVWHIFICLMWPRGRHLCLVLSAWAQKNRHWVFEPLKHRKKRCPRKLQVWSVLLYSCGVCAWSVERDVYSPLWAKWVSFFIYFFVKCLCVGFGEGARRKNCVFFSFFLCPLLPSSPPPPPPAPVWDWLVTLLNNSNWLASAVGDSQTANHSGSPQRALPFFSSCGQRRLSIASEKKSSKVQPTFKNK